MRTLRESFGSFFPLFLVTHGVAVCCCCCFLGRGWKVVFDGGEGDECVEREEE